MQLHHRTSPGGAGERRVDGDERGAQCLREGDVGRVVGSYVLSQLPDARTQWHVGVAGGAKVVQSAERSTRPSLREDPSERVTADRGDHLEIEHVRNVQRLAALSDAGAQASP